MNRIVLLVSLFLTPIGAFAVDPPAKTLTPADNLVVDGIPPIPADLPEQVGRYTESRAAGLQDWHPTRPEMLITTRFVIFCALFKGAMRSRNSVIREHLLK